MRPPGWVRANPARNYTQGKCEARSRERVQPSHRTGDRRRRVRPGSLASISARTCVCADAGRLQLRGDHIGQHLRAPRESNIHTPESGRGARRRALRLGAARDERRRGMHCASGTSVSPAEGDRGQGRRAPKECRRRHSTRWRLGPSCAARRPTRNFTDDMMPRSTMAPTRATAALAPRRRLPLRQWSDRSAWRLPRTGTTCAGPFCALNEETF
jgi:hypothetical protein